MKAGWEVKMLGEVCAIQNGGTPKSNIADYWGDEVPWLTPKDMGQQETAYVADTPRMITKIGLSKCSAKLIPVGSVIMSTRAPIGHLSINTVPMAFNQGCRGLTPSDKLDLKYLFYFLTGNVEHLQELGTGATFKELSAGSLKGYEIPIPPLKEQKRIVAVLDAAFEGLTRAKENAEANLQNARELFEATLDKWLVQDAQQWPKYELSSLGKLTTGGTPKSGEADQYGNALPFIKPGHFRTDGSLDYDDVGLSDAGLAGARIIPENSAVMVCIGATIGKSGYNDRPIATNQQINALTPNDGLHHYFAYLHFITPTFQKQVIANSGQATLPIINKSKWGKLKIGVPSDLNVQQSIVDRMTENRAKVDLAAQDYRTKLTDIADLHQSLLQKAFAGELT
ncbi:restriction endonuclease subunit S [Pseudogemmobacter sp. W21_MBD1_M6]|uniref:restriction endonuclease subunit S n=1 Tax=Pseudogemmobacter sp. W21_MBD1_M6 TaxID=3240271 RepID=UPI003F9B6188